MSFMFNPYPYEDPGPLNKPELSEETAGSIVSGLPGIASRIAGEIERRLKRQSPMTVCIDGYATAEWAQTVNLISGKLREKGFDCRVFNAASYYKSSGELDAMLSCSLPDDRKKDPVLLFGKLWEGGYETLFDEDKLACLKRGIAGQAEDGGKAVNIIYGAGACFKGLRDICKMSVYFDVTPKQAVLRIKDGRYINLGDKDSRPFRETMRRSYYYDFELAMRLRMELVKEDRIDFYIASDSPEKMQFIPKKAFNEICSSLVRYPFRCKPVYLEGVWGGHYVKKLRGLPEEMKNCAWVFDLIPLEVSLLVEAGENIVEIPFFTFVCKEGVSLMGGDCADAFKGYFPIRLNYDDTYHSSGNMSIQVHPGDNYIKENFNEHGRQDESYYVVAAGHGARTFAGFKNEAAAEEFLNEAKKSEKSSAPVDYEKYIQWFDSKPGMQFLLPAGTLHASGRNQLILEIGSLTVGSYTFKMYDYLRPDLDGKPRPIHTLHGERVLVQERAGEWVDKNLVREPVKLRSGDGWAEYLAGEIDLMYFSLYVYEFEKKISGDTGGVFHALTLVDGEKVAVYPKKHPERRYVQNYLDIVLVPAQTGEYVIENLGEQPVRVHKTCLKKNFREYV